MPNPNIHVIETTALRNRLLSQAQSNEIEYELETLNREECAILCDTLLENHSLIWSIDVSPKHKIRSDFGVEILEALKACKNLQYLSLENLIIDKAIVQLLNEIFQQNERLHSLVLGRTLESNGEYHEEREALKEFIDNCIKMPHLKVLDLSNRDLNEYGKRIARLLKSPELTHLNVHNCLLNEEDLREIISALTNSRLTTLDLSGNHLNKTNSRTLHNVLPKTSITTLILE